MRHSLAASLLRWLLSVGALLVLMVVLVHVTPGGPCAARAGSLGAQVSKPECFRALALTSSPPRQAAAQLSLYLHGDFGTTNLGHTVWGDVRSSVPATVILWLLALVITAITTSVYQRVQRGFVGRPLAATITLLGLLPGFWIGLMLVFLIGYRWNLLPTTHGQSITLPGVGSRSWFHLLVQQPSTVMGDLLRHFTMPVTVLVAMLLPPWIRFIRRPGSGHAYGFWAVMVVLAPRSLSLLIGATIVIESIFQLNGVGYLFVRSLRTGDFAICLAVFLLTVFLSMSMGLVDSVVRSAKSSGKDRRMAHETVG